MITDAINSLPVPQAPDVKVEQNLETVEPRAVEDSYQGEDAHLDINRQNIAKPSPETDGSEESGVEIGAYNAKGYFISETSLQQSSGKPQDSINLIV